MTCIVEGFKSKKDLKERVKCFGPEPVDPRLDFYISNPSPFPQGTYEFNGMAGHMPVGKKVIVTNHPKRSWFATIERTSKGWRVS